MSYGQCQCIQRISLILQYYTNHWIRSPQNRIMGIAYLIPVLQDCSIHALLNDFYHLKRFHGDQSGSRNSNPLSQFFLMQLI